MRTLTKWGYVTQSFIVPKLDIFYRAQTTDEKVIDEVLVNHVYQNRTAKMQVETSDCWLDLGANIGTFALLALSAGGSVLSVEPEQHNLTLLRKNVAHNFTNKPTPRFRVLEAGVACSSGEMPLYLCNGDYNKYRHSMYLQKNRASVSVPVIAFAKLLQERVGKHTINAVKMDIEGMEIELLEKCVDRQTFANVRKLVFEYTFDVDPSIPRFMRIINTLRKFFPVVHFTRVNPNEKEYRYYPPCTTVYCVRNTS